MNTAFALVLTVMSQVQAPVNNSSVTLQPQAAIVITGTTEKNAQTNCNRVMKAFATSGIIAFCSPQTEKTADVSK